jgi:hypothetical protein
MNRRDALKNTALLGGSIALSSTLLTLLQSCQEENRLGWQPRFLSTDQAQLVSSLVDTILPTTETPGGLEVKVDLFIDRVLAELYSEEAQKSVAAEMEQFNEQCVSQFGSPFAQLDPGQKKKVLQAEETQSPKYNGGVWGTTVGEQKPVGFYRSFKSLALWGYFSSEEIGKNVLAYDPVPGEYLGCIPLSEVGKIWSL